MSAVPASAVGTTYPPSAYLVGREKIAEFAAATFEADPLCSDVAAARAAGHADLVAPPMFCVVYQGRAIAPAMFDPVLGIDFAHLLHTAQQFRWGPLVVAGDEISSVVTVADVAQRAGVGIYVFEIVSTNVAGETVCEGVWTNHVRSPE